jgi:5-oxoprolinase (ATP-hydrolysing) subunit A
MSAVIDINCDMGEGIGNDELIMPFISSASIACGYHAGDEKTMSDTISLALKHGVAIGAHVSFHDRDNFGRHEMNLSPAEVYELVWQQLFILDQIAVLSEANLHHVKPHGALYNMSAKDPLLADSIARAVKDFNDKLVLFGLSKSHSVEAAKAIGLQTASEVFADRSYQPDGSLTPRSKQGALLEDSNKVVEQVLQMVNHKTVTTVTGDILAIDAETICIHGDGAQAVTFAQAIYKNLKESNIEIKTT